MLDWNNIFNIAFVAGIGGLSLFFLVSTIAVAAKGKRKCNAFDVILRLLSSLCLIAAVLIIGCAVLSTIEGDLCIYFVQNASGEPSVPTLAFFGKDIVLPVADLFLIFSTTIGVVIGFALAAALFVLSLMALIVDCLVANKKDKKLKADKKQKAAASKTPEQIKREKELERIKKIGESAVQKTSKAADRKAEKEESKPEAAETVEQTEEPASDWRDEPKASVKNDSVEFVGISDNTENEFDTFDEVQSGAPVAEDTDEETAEPVEEIVDEPIEEVIDEQPIEDDDPVGVVDEPTEIDEPIEEVSDEFKEAEVLIEETDEQPVEDEAPAEEIADEQADEAIELTEEISDEPIEDEPVEQVADEQPEDIAADEVVEESERTEQVADEEATEPEAAEPEPEPTERVAADATGEYGEIEPDRGIYIPEIRTIVKSGEDEEKESAPPAKKAASASKKPAASRTSGTKKAPASGTKKTPASGTKSTRKPAAKSEDAAQKPTSTRTSAKNGGPKPRTAQPSETPEGKKLPVTRRYVILDRRNAVNMFGEYLRERNKADKEKLQSSINTIIIE